MSNNTLNQLPPETVKLISSAQVITSVSTAVKELVENALDANSRNIQVRLENYGFDLLEVKDDGHGVPYNNVQRMFLSGYTSKIACFNDLGKLETYGFRGEALFALTKLSNVTLTTKTSADSLAMTYVINNEGLPESSKPSHLLKGTIISATNIFGNLPVRKQYLSSKKKAAEELKKVEHVVQSLSAIHPELRITLVHNKCSIWQKNSVKGIKQSFMQIVGLKTVTKMEHLNELANNILVDLIIPKKGLENVDSIFSSSSQSIYTYVNRRPVILSKLSKVVTEHILLQYSHLDHTSKYAVCLISVEVPPQEIDVNVEPNKTKVFLKNEVEVMNLLDNMLSSYYNQKINKQEPEQQEAEEEKLDEESNSNPEDVDDLNDENGRKRPRLDNVDSTLREVARVRDKEFSDKNNGWRLEIISADENAQSKNNVLNLCSQINKENCTLTTVSEVGELNRLMNENNQKLVTSVTPDSETRLIDRGETQNYNQLKKDCGIEETKSKQTSECVAHLVEKPTLPSWPVRQLPEKSVAREGMTSEKPENRLLDVGFLENINLEDWSKGIVNLDGRVLEGGVTLQRPLSPDKGLHNLDQDVQQFDLSMQSVSSQMGKKELSAFTKFARIMRPKILSEFPGIMFTKVSGLLVDRWKALPEDEKKYYEKLAKVVDQKREIHQEFRTLKEDNESKSPPPKKKPKGTDKKPLRFELKIVASIDAVIRKRNVKWKDVADNEIRAIGQLNPSGNWLYKKGNEIGHVRHYGLQELILSERMLSNHNVPRQPVPKEIRINEDILGSDLWNILTGLDVEYNPINNRYAVTSPVIAKNGFNIDLEKREDAFYVGWITDTASVIPFYGIAELKEALTLYKNMGEFADLRNIRPVAVINYITNEVIRIVRQTPRPPDHRDIKEWIDTWQMCFSHLPPRCLHSYDIFIPVYHLQNFNDKDVFGELLHSVKYSLKQK